MSEEQTMVAKSAESADVREVDELAVYQWRVFKRQEPTNTGVGITRGIPDEVAWIELAAIRSAYAYASPEPQQIGTEYGAGDYLLIHDATARFVTVVQSAPRYERAGEDES